MMKTTVVLFLFTLFIYPVSAQDILVLKSGRELKVSIVGEKDNVISYRDYNDPGGPLFSVTRDKVEAVKYGRKSGQSVENSAATGGKKNDTPSAVVSGPGLLTVKNRYVLQNGKIQSPRQVKEIMIDQPGAFDLYSSGRRLCKTSNACAMGITLTCFTASLISNKMEENSRMTVLASALGISGGLAIYGIVTASVGKKKIRGAVELFNTNSNKPVSYDFDLKLAPGGVAFTVRF